MRKYASIALIPLFLVGWFVGEWFMFRGIAPPPEAHTLEGWLTWQSGAEDFVELPGDTHLMAFGRGAGLVPSGPSAYVFDASGRLVAWTYDLGDNDAFNKKWSVTYPLNFIDRNAAAQWPPKRLSPVNGSPRPTEDTHDAE